MTQPPKTAGRKIRCPEGYTAFIPALLPPKLTWAPDLVRALSDADRTVGWLAGEGGRLPGGEEDSDFRGSAAFVPEDQGNGACGLDSICPCGLKKLSRFFVDF